MSLFCSSSSRRHRSCSLLCLLALLQAAAGQLPSRAPTAVPTKNPTTNPTANPTAPTAPTAPTKSPTVNPTTNPTTLNPTTTNPTHNPTHDPTFNTRPCDTMHDEDADVCIQNTYCLPLMGFVSAHTKEYLDHCMWINSTAINFFDHCVQEESTGRVAYIEYGELPDGWKELPAHNQAKPPPPQHQQ